MTDKITLEDGAFYVVEFPFTSELEETARTVAQYERGRFWTTNEAGYDDEGPPPAEDFGLHRAPQNQSLAGLRLPARAPAKSLGPGVP